MTEEEAIILYLRKHAGHRMHFCKMLNQLTKELTGFVRDRFPVTKEVKNAVWVRLAQAANRLIKSGDVTLHRKREGGKRNPTVRLNEALVRNPFYATKHE